MLLDVDGTILPTRFPWTTTNPRGLREYEIVVPPYAPITVRVRPYVIEAINFWHAQGVDRGWHSSWGWKAQWLARSLGLPELELFYEPSAGDISLYSRSQRPWKRFALQGIAETFAEPMRIFWVDNEPASGQTKYLEKNLSDMHPNLSEVRIVRPNEERGLLKADLLRAEKLLGIDPPA